MVDRDLDHLTPDTRRRVKQLLSWGKSRGYDLFVAETYRSAERQNQLYAQGRGAPGAVVTGAPGCRSWHTWGRAADIWICKARAASGSCVPDWAAERYAPLGAYWEQLGGRWGGRFGDSVHFEYHPNVDKSAEVCPDPARPQTPSAAQLQQANTMTRVATAVVVGSIALSYVLWRRAKGKPLNPLGTSRG